MNEELPSNQGSNPIHIEQQDVSGLGQHITKGFGLTLGVILAIFVVLGGITLVVFIHASIREAQRKAEIAEYEAIQHKQRQHDLEIQDKRERQLALEKKRAELTAETERKRAEIAQLAENKRLAEERKAQALEEAERQKRLDELRVRQEKEREIADNKAKAEADAREKELAQERAIKAMKEKEEAEAEKKALENRKKLYAQLLAEKARIDMEAFMLGKTIEDPIERLKKVNDFLKTEWKTNCEVHGISVSEGEELLKLGKKEKWPS